MITKLVKLANHLDSIGEHDLADQIDAIVKSAALLSARNSLIDALKNDDTKKANDAIMELVSQIPRGSNAADELGISSKEFKELANAIHTGDLESARKVFNVGKAVSKDPNKINPFTGQPWPSGEVKEEPKQSDTGKKKYEFTGKETSTRGFGGVKVKEIMRLSDGKIGGWIEKEENLSHEGQCFVYDNAMVYNDATVTEDAIVCGNAHVYGTVSVSGRTHVAEKAHVHGNAKISGIGYIGGNAEILEDAEISEDASVYDDAIVGGSAKISGTADIRGNAKVFIDFSSGTVSSGTHV